MPVEDLSWDGPLEKEMTAHSSILAWRILWTEELSGLHTVWDLKELDMTEPLTQTLYLSAPEFFVGFYLFSIDIFLICHFRTFLHTFLYRASLRQAF